MSSDAGGSSGNGSNSGNGSGNPSASDGVNVEALINEAVNKALGARLKRLNLDEMVAKALEPHLSKMAADAPQAQTGAPPAADSGDGKISLKALHEQIAKLTQGIQDRDKQVLQERQRAQEIRLRSEVQSQFAKHLGADSPHLRPYVNEYLTQFADQDGRPVRKVKNDYGEESYVPASQAIEELFKGELKHLVNSSKAANLPRSNPTGNPYAPPTHHAPTGSEQVHPLIGEFARHFAQHGNVETANAIIAAQPSDPTKK